MQAMAFMVLMMILFGIGLVCLIAGVIMTVINRNIRKRGFTKKWLKVLSIITLALGAVFIIIPAGWMLMLRSANGATDEDYVDTKTMLTWEKGGTFTYEDVTYVDFSSKLKEDAYMMETGIEEPGKVAFNIKNRNGFWEVLFNAYDRQNVYAVENDAGVTMYYCDGSLYCPKEDAGKAMAYYKDEKHYKWLLAEGEDDEIEHVLSLTGEEQKFLRSLKPSMAAQSFEIEKGDSAMLVTKSRDGVIRYETSVMCYNKDWYWDSEKEPEQEEVSGDPLDYTKVYKLPGELSDHIQQSL